MAAVLNRKVSNVKTRVDAYFDEAPTFAGKLCRELRRVVLKAEPEMVEEWKWGPHYSCGGAVCGIGAFKAHVTLAFFQGALMKDPQHLFIKEDIPAKSMRRIKFVAGGKIDDSVLIPYVREAVSLNSSGTTKTNDAVHMPAEVRKLLAKNKKASSFFESLSYTNRKEYIRWIETAKKEETRRSRLMKIVPMLNAKIKHP